MKLGARGSGMGKLLCMKRKTRVRRKINKALLEDVARVDGQMML